MCVILGAVTETNLVIVWLPFAYRLQICDKISTFKILFILKISCSLPPAGEGWPTVLDSFLLARKVPA